jgi:hypothetical protein
VSGDKVKTPGELADRYVYQFIESCSEQTVKLLKKSFLAGYGFGYQINERQIADWIWQSRKELRKSNIKMQIVVGIVCLWLGYKIGSAP